MADQNYKYVLLDYVVQGQHIHAEYIKKIENVKNYCVLFETHLYSDFSVSLNACDTVFHTRTHARILAHTYEHTYAQNKQRVYILP